MWKGDGKLHANLKCEDDKGTELAKMTKFWKMGNTNLGQIEVLPGEMDKRGEDFWDEVVFSGVGMLLRARYMNYIATIST